MKRMNSWMVLVLAFANLQLTACTSSKSELAPREPPATIEAVNGSELRRVMFTEQALENIGIETAFVGNGVIRRVKQITVPYAALLYDSHGGTWVYKVVETRTFMRHPVTVDRIVNGKVYLIDGPDLGTEIVTVGASFVFGAEFEVGH